MVNHWLKPISLTNESKWVEDETIDTAFYIGDYRNNNNFVSNSGLVERKINAWHREPLNYEIDLERASIKKGGLMDLITQDTLYVKMNDNDEDILYFPGGRCLRPKAVIFRNLPL